MVFYCETLKKYVCRIETFFYTCLEPFAGEFFNMKGTFSYGVRFLRNSFSELAKIDRVAGRKTLLKVGCIDRHLHKKGFSRSIYS